MQVDVVATIGQSPVPTKKTLKEWIKDRPERVQFLPAEVINPLADAFRNTASRIPESPHFALVHGPRWSAIVTRKGDKLTVK